MVHADRNIMSSVSASNGGAQEEKSDGTRGATGTSEDAQSIESRLFAETAFGKPSALRQEQEQEREREREQEQEQEQEQERASLQAAFRETRRRSAHSALTTVEAWEDRDIIPCHMDSEDFEMFVYDFLQKARSRQDERPSKPCGETVYRTATTEVGVPPSIASTPSENAGSADEPREYGEDASEKAPVRETAPIRSGQGQPRQAAPSASDDFIPLSLEEAGLPEDFPIPEGFALALVENEPVLVPLDEDGEDGGAVECDDIALLMGSSRYYLYSRDYMSDQYAHWAFLAQEDDRVATFVDCVREESRVYPRPMPMKSLENPPFLFTQEEIEEVWMAVSESGDHPDIGRTEASNGAVYFYSTEYLSPAYAESLAEWDAVEKLYSV